MRIGPLLLLLLAAAVVQAQNGVPAQNAPKPKADLIFTHGNVYTGVVDPAASLGSGKRAEALAIRGDRILAVGMPDDVMKLKGPETKVVDLGWPLRHARLQRCPLAPGQCRHGENDREPGRRQDSG